MVVQLRALPLRDARTSLPCLDRRSRTTREVVSVPCVEGSPLHPADARCTCRFGALQHTSSFGDRTVMFLQSGLVFENPPRRLRQPASKSQMSHNIKHGVEDASCEKDDHLPSES